MKKPTKKEWMQHHTEMHILEAWWQRHYTAHNPYVFDPKGRDFVTPRRSLGIALDHVTNTDLLDNTDPKEK